MIVLDAGVLIGVLDPQDTHHGAAEAIWQTVLDELGANPLTLAEVLVGPARAGRLDAVREALRDLEVQELSFPVDTVGPLAELRAATALKLPDCCVLLSAAAVGGSVASFNARLLRAAVSQGLAVVDPTRLAGGQGG